VWAAAVVALAYKFRHGPSKCVEPISVNQHDGSMHSRIEASQCNCKTTAAAVLERCGEYDTAVQVVDS